jgi:Uncharacterised nucleotidyltransferase
MSEFPVPGKNFSYRKESFFPYLHEINKPVENDFFLKEFNSWRFKLLLWLDKFKEIIVLFDENNIDCVLAKGFALSTVYPTIFSRPFTDFDLFIRKRDFARAKIIVLSLGYKQLLNKNIHSSIHHSFTKKNYPPIELHYSYSRDFKLNISYEDLFFKNSSTISFDQLKIKIPNPLNHALFILLHALNHSFANAPLWGLDLLLLFKKHKNLKTELISLMKNLDLEYLLQLGFLLIDNIFPDENDKIEIHGVDYIKTSIGYKTIQICWKLNRFPQIITILFRFISQKKFVEKINFLISRF